MKKNKDLNYYLNLPWTYTVEEEIDTESGNKIYIVSINELPGLKTDVDSKEKVFEEIQEALHAALELYLEMGERIPEPQKLDEKKFKGKITYRTTQERHIQLAQEAKKRKIPVNKLIDEYIGHALSAKKN